MPPLLSVRDLTVAFPAEGSLLPVVREVEFAIHRSELVGLVGESGSGKTLTALSILRLLPPQARVLSGRIELDGEDLSGCSETRLRQVRGQTVAMVFQEPITALNPVLTVGYQLGEALQATGGKRKTREQEARALLDLVGIPGSAARLGDYPYQLSGGQRQRVMIAMALAAKPRLLIADEPTSALDVTVQAQILELLEELRERLDLAILLITHDLSLVAQTCDRVMVMYAGQIVEDADVGSLYASPAHPYTRALIEAIPRLGAGIQSGILPTLPGRVPDPRDRPVGCAFHPRCSDAFDSCPESEPALLDVSTGQRARCLLYDPVVVARESG